MGQSNKKEKEVRVQLRLQEEKFFKELFTFLVISGMLGNYSLAIIHKQTASYLLCGDISFLLSVCEMIFGNRQFGFQLTKINEMGNIEKIATTARQQTIQMIRFNNENEVANTFCSLILKQQASFYERVSLEFDKFSCKIKKKEILKEEQIEVLCNFLLQSDPKDFSTLQEAIPIRRGYHLCAVENIMNLAPCSSETKQKMLENHTSLVKRLNFIKEYEKLNASELMDDLECRKYFTIVFPISLIDIIASYDVKRNQDIVNKRLMTLS